MLDMRPRGVGGGSSSAPFDATYITQTPNATLTNEQALSLLATGLLKNTTATGILSIAVPTIDFASAAQGALADTALQPADIGVSVQAWDADLDTLAGLAKADSNFIVGDGAAWVVESGATVRTSLGLGTIATQNANNVTISGGSVTGITDLAIADGGTGQSTAQLAINALTAVSGATNEHVLTKDTATGNAVFKAATGGSGTPGGSDTQVQFNDGGAFGGDADFTWNKTTNTLTLAGPMSQAFGSGTTIYHTFGSSTLKSRFLSASLTGNFQWRTNIDGTTNKDDATKIAFAFVQDVASNNEFAVYIFPVSSGYVQLLGVRQAGMIMGISGGSDTVFPSPGSRFDIYEKSDTGTTSISTLLQLRKNLNSGTPGVGFGAQIRVSLESSTTEDTIVGRLSYEWATATHASRKARSKWTVYDTAEREGIRIEADGSNPMIGFLGAAAIARPTTYTLASTATRTMPTPEAAFTGQDNAQAGSVYAKSADLITLQTRLDSVEGVLRQLIIDLASTSGYGLLVAS